MNKPAIQFPAPLWTPVDHLGIKGPGIYLACAPITKDPHYHATPEESKRAEQAVADIIRNMNNCPGLVGALKQALDSLQMLAHEAGDVPEWNEGGHARETCKLIRAELAKIQA
jgi:hypothetical protein